MDLDNEPTMRPQKRAAPTVKHLGSIDQYELIRELGGGGFGCVYLACDTVAGIDVAVKGLPPLVRLNKEELENVRKNFALVSRLHHPNIAAALTLHPVTNAFYNDKDDAEKLRVFNGDTLVVMQYAPGVTLSQWRKQFPDGKVPLDKALEITRQIASALDYAHKEKILHRDIKPANVMIETGADGSLTARVLDFGLAAEIRSSMSRVSQSITDTSGTRPYMAPEQWLGEEQGKETDQYALAVLFNELVTGKVPFVSVFDTGDPVLMMNVVGNRAFNPPSDLPKTIRLALIKALAKKREDRFESCIAFVDALVGRGVLTAPSGKAFGKIAAVGLLVLGLAGGVWYWQDAKAKEEARIVAEQKAEAERKAAEEARRIAEEKAKKEKAERRQKEEAERETEARVADIMVEATVKKNQLLRIDDADGFQDRKTILSDLLTKATAFGKAKQWDKAALNFTNYVEGCNKLITLDGERKAAKEKQSAALVSQRQAANAESSKYASVRWGAASDVMKKASEHFSQMEFSEAKGFYESAANQFKLCISEAKNERERQEKEQVRRAKWRKEGEPYTIEPEGLNLTMKWCPAGSFMMGNKNKEWRIHDEDPHRVDIKQGFWIGETEITQKQWMMLMDGETVEDLARMALQDDTIFNFNGKKQTLREFWNLDRNYDSKNICSDICDDEPVYIVSKNQAMKFCLRLTEFERKKHLIPDNYVYRLPTEAEWEYACRAGTTTALPNNQNLNIDGNVNTNALNGIAWFSENSYIGFKGRGICRWPPFGKASARSVKKKLPNNWGVYDMLGNVWEWCLNSSYDTTNKDVEKGVRRGGSWKTGAKWCQSAVRSKVFACLPLSDTGFRVVLAPTHPDKACPKAPVVIVPIEDEKSDNKAYVKTHNENEKVQLWEDGPYWATKNIGAEKPEDYGYYFWWGDTVGYKRVDDRWVASDGSASNFKFRSSNTPTCGKSVSDLRSEGWITADGVLSPQHDAAQKHWGGDWRMPTKMELEDLDSKCDWCRTQVNGVNGHVVRGKGVYSSKSIFLPCADYGYGALFDNAGSSGNYWSSVPCSDNSAWFLESGSGGYRRTYGNSRDYGRSVRPLQGFTK